MRSRTTIATGAAVASVLALVAISALTGPSHVSRAHAAKTSAVKLGEYFYRPKRVTIAAGDLVRFTNVGKIEHTVADSTKSGALRSRVIRPRPLEHGQSQTVRFRRRGTVYYVCTFHPALMRGVVIVR
jgi:plastocyanin